MIAFLNRLELIPIQNHHQKSSLMITNFILQLWNQCSQQLNQITLFMEDSLQLPDDTQCINLQNLLSPEPLIKDSRENTPPHSLAYSNSTCVKDKFGEIHMRSPLAFESNAHLGEYSPTRTGYIKTNNQNHPINYQRTVNCSPQRVEPEKIISEYSRIKAKGPNKKISQNQKIISNKTSSINAIKQIQHESKKKDVKQSENQRQEQRKTIAKGETSKLASRVKQLQQALHIETVISEELRTKLSVTNKLLQSKLKDNGLDFFMNFKNSSRDLRNIDIFVQMSTLQKTLTQKMIIIDRQKGQLKQANLEIQRLKQKKQLQKSPARKLNEQIEKLIQQKQSLISYIDEQKATLKRKIDYIAQLQSQINRMGDKQSHYTDIERPKIISQLSEIKSENKKLHEQLDQIKMEMNLIQINHKEEIQGLHIKNKEIENTLLYQEQELQRFKKLSNENQTKGHKEAQIQKNDEEKQVLIKELTLLKEQRDHYLSQYRKRTAQSSKLYALQLKLAALENNRMTN